MTPQFHRATSTFYYLGAGLTLWTVWQLVRRPVFSGRPDSGELGAGFYVGVDVYRRSYRRWAIGESIAALTAGVVAVLTFSLPLQARFAAGGIDGHRRRCAG